MLIELGLHNLVEDDYSVWLREKYSLDLLLLGLLVLMCRELGHQRLVLEVDSHENGQEQT